MRRLINWMWLVLFGVAVLNVIGAVHAETAVPKLQGRVNDFANVLSDTQRRNVDRALENYEHSRNDKPQLVAVTLQSMPDEGIEAFGVRLLREWGIGQKEANNGAVFLLVPSARKMRLEIGRGIEGAITDSEAHFINTEVAAPYLKKGQYDQAIIAVANRMASKLDPDTKPEKVDIDHTNAWILAFVALCIGGGVFFPLRQRSRRNKQAREQAESVRREQRRQETERLAAAAAARTRDRAQREAAALRAGSLAGAAGYGLAPSPLKPKPAPAKPPIPAKSSRSSSNRRRDDDNSSWASAPSSSWSSSDSSSSSSSSFSGGGGDSSGGGSTDSW